MLIMSSIRLESKRKICSIWSLLYESVMQASDLDCPLESQFVIVGSVNGLICLRCLQSKDFLLWNPSIRKFKQVAALKDWEFHLLSAHGFGYDELHDDYKIVSIKGITNINVKVEIYSLKSDSWRRVDDFQGGLLCIRSGVLVNGKLHWINRGAIVSIDLADEKWGKLEKPLEGGSCWQLGVLGSDLSLFHCYERTCTNVWVMKEYGVNESWAKIYTFKFPNDTPDVWYPSLFKSKNGEVLIVFEARFMIYYPKDDSIEQVARLHPYFTADFFIESLVCPFPIEPRTTTMKAPTHKLMTIGS